MNVYVYTFKDGLYSYERTCGTEEAAISRVDELKRRGISATYLINHTINGAYY